MVKKNEEPQIPKADVLKGIEAIATFADASYRTLMTWKAQYPGMPMNKVGGVYRADPDRLRQFLKDLAAAEVEQYGVK